MHRTTYTQDRIYTGPQTHRTNTGPHIHRTTYTQATHTQDHRYTHLLPGHGLGVHDVLLDLLASLDHGLPQHSPQGGFARPTGAHHHHPHALPQLLKQLQCLLHLHREWTNSETCQTSGQRQIGAQLQCLLCLQRERTDPETCQTRSTRGNKVQLQGFFHLQEEWTDSESCQTLPPRDSEMPTVTTSTASD